MIDVDDLRKEVMEVIKDVNENCKNLDTVYNVVDWAIKVVSDEIEKNVFEIYIPKVKKDEENS